MSDNAPALLKDILGPQALTTIADAGASASLRFDRAAFLATATEGLDTLSIMERVRHIADALRPALPADYAAALEVIGAMAPRLTHGFQAVAVTEYVARYGLDDFDRSMDALASLTRFGTAEFAIRPFLAQDADRALAAMARWTGSDDEHVRRLASEGGRPRLPWAARVPALKADPTRAAHILETLKADPSLYVRKSVANHLNDISKDHPDKTLYVLHSWDRDHPHTAWIAKRALRTLIKESHAGALALMGAGEAAKVRINSFAVSPTAVTLGERIQLSLHLTSTASKSQRLLIDYVVHYVKQSGGTSGKVFKWKELDLAPGETFTLEKRQTIRDFTTRRHYPGTHRVEVQVNGARLAEGEFGVG